MKYIHALATFLITSLACAGEPDGTAANGSLAAPSGPQLAHLVQDKGDCLLEIKSLGAQSVERARWLGACAENWGISASSKAPGDDFVLTVGSSIIRVAGGNAQVLGPLPTGSLVVAGLTATGHVEAISEQDEAADRSGSADTGLYSTVVCRRWQLRGSTWAEIASESITMGEGAMGCNGQVGDYIKVVIPNPVGPHGQVGYVEKTAPPSNQPLPTTPKLDEYSSWFYDGDLKLLTGLTEGISGMIRTTPVLRWDEGKWVPLPGLEAPNRAIDLDADQSGTYVLTCTDTQASVVNLATGEGAWSTTGTCPSWWPVPVK